MFCIFYTENCYRTRVYRENIFADARIYLGLIDFLALLFSKVSCTRNGYTFFKIKPNPTDSKHVSNVLCGRKKDMVRHSASRYPSTIVI